MEEINIILTVTLDNQGTHFDIQSGFNSTQTVEALRKAAELLEQVSVSTFPTSNYTS